MVGHESLNHVYSSLLEQGHTVKNLPHQTQKQRSGSLSANEIHDEPSVNEAVDSKERISELDLRLFLQHLQVHSSLLGLHSR